MANPWDTESVEDQIKTFKKWAAKQDPEYIAKVFCEHGKYIGVGGVFRYKCKRGCNGSN